MWLGEKLFTLAENPTQEQTWGKRTGNPAPKMLVKASQLDNAVTFQAGRGLINVYAEVRMSGLEKVKGRRSFRAVNNLQSFLGEGLRLSKPLSGEHKRRLS